MPASDIITTAQYLVAVGRSITDTDATEQAKIQWAVTVASQAIRQYLDRDLSLAATATPGPRTFRYYGNQELEIDDCTVVNSVQLVPTPWSNSTRVLSPMEWIAAPSSANLPVIDFIELLTNIPLISNPAMGFTYNADTYGYRPHPVVISVDAAWGWASLPPSIMQATVWTTADVLSDESPYVTQTIEGYSHSYRDTRPAGGANSAPVTQQAVPPRAQALLDPYVRTLV